MSCATHVVCSQPDLNRCFMDENHVSWTGLDDGSGLVYYIMIFNIVDVLVIPLYADCRSDKMSE